MRLELDETERKLVSAVRSCNHRWGAVTPDHIYHKGYTIPGDPPGTMGVDWRGPCDVAAKTDFRWKRVCQECGEIQYTTRTTETITKTPTFE